MERVNDYQKKRVVKLDGYTPYPSRKGCYTFLVMGIDNCVVSFDNMTRAQMCVLWRAFDADESVLAYTITEF